MSDFLKMIFDDLAESLEEEAVLQKASPEVCSALNSVADRLRCIDWAYYDSLEHVA